MTTQRGIAKIVISKSLTNEQFRRIQVGRIRSLLLDILAPVERHLATSRAEVKNIAPETVFLYLRAMSRTCSQCGKFSEFEGFSQWVRPRKRLGPDNRLTLYSWTVEKVGPTFLCNNCCYDFKEGCFRSKEFGRVCEIQGDNLVFYRYDFSKKTSYVFELNGDKFPDFRDRGNKGTVKTLNSSLRGGFIMLVDLVDMKKRVGLRW